MPKDLLSSMNVEGLTRENVSSHLQKFRIRQAREERKRAFLASRLPGVSATSTSPSPNSTSESPYSSPSSFHSSGSSIPYAYPPSHPPKIDEKGDSLLSQEHHLSESNNDTSVAVPIEDNNNNTYTSRQEQDGNEEMEDIEDPAPTESMSEPHILLPPVGEEEEQLRNLEVVYFSPFFGQQL